MGRSENRWPGDDISAANSLQSKGRNPLSMDNFRNRVLNPILRQLGIDKKLKAMGIKRCRNYAFRHMTQL